MGILFVRRWLLIIATLLGVVSLVYAFKPFSGVDAFGTTTVASAQHCGAPVSDAWRGNDEIWAQSTRSGASSYVDISTCRSESRLRLARAGFGVLLAIGCAGFAFVISRRRRFDIAPEPA